MYIYICLFLARNVDLNELREAYENSCFRHDTRPIETVVNQLQVLLCIGSELSDLLQYCVSEPGLK